MGKPAVTHYRIMEHFVCTRVCGCVWKLDVRTRSACIWPNHSSAGGRSVLWWPSASAKRCFGKHLSSTLRKFDRQALHATMLRLYHPISGIEMEWHAPIPQDMVELIEVMRADFEEHKDEVDWL